MRSRRWTVRRKLNALLLLPLLSLTALWAYGANLSLGNALTLAHVDTIGTRLAHPLGEVVIDLQVERRNSLIALALQAPAEKGRSDRAHWRDLAASRAATDTSVRAFLAEAEQSSVRDVENPEVRRSVDAAEDALAGIGGLRRQIDSLALPPAEALASYTAVNAAISGAFHAMTILPDEEAQKFGQALDTLVVGGDFLSQEDALISAAAVSAHHRLDPASYSAVVQNIGAARHFTAMALQSLPAPQRAQFEALSKDGGPQAKVTAMEEQIIAAGPDAPGLPFPVLEWRKAYDAQWRATNQLALNDISVVFTLTGPPATRAFVELLVSGLFGLGLLVASGLLSVRITRSLVSDLGRLNESARSLTDVKLRDVVGRLRRGELVDVEDDLRRPDFVNREIAELGEAFHALQSTAVELAAEDIRLRRGISDVFANLARRSQSLVNRQLSLLDSMEKQEEDPALLQSLFQLDHLATRQRRYAEGLIIVSGSSTGRVWRHPVPAVDVVRGAVAETEGYDRVIVPPVPPVGISGHAAADIVHLLAELIENAQNFSPAGSQIRVGAGVGAGGLVVEIDDRGLGMLPEDLQAANERITQSVDVSAVDSTRLGLVTVGRLSQRHGVHVTLRSSPYGGITAIVLIPNTLLEDPARPAEPADTRAEPGAAPGSGPGRLPGPAGAPALRARPPQAGPAPEWAPAGPAAPTGAWTPATHAHPGALPAGTVEPWRHTAGTSPAAASSAQVQDQAAATVPEMIDGLPRRVRQASLAPQLKTENAGPPAPPDWGGARSGDHTPAAGPAPYRGGLPGPGVTGVLDPWSVRQLDADASGAAPDGGEAVADGPATSRPAQVRSLMSALQAGAARGRLEPL
ncbi:nitrate- and nitrite sensing domain-containing protein [Actinacidiphila sp. bgisy167]|uniref:sensor histidine kinase n=1 Tax=Actinacidiphila sp. bgisy167 TaxID=3413797 RepID=UPI003D7084F5